MRAMILAAGLGTRLRPLTDHRPKALVEINGRTLLEISLSRLRGFGVREVILNVHHFADMIVEHLRAHDDFGMKIEISREDTLLETGGGLKKAALFFARAGKKHGHPHPEEPFILHNVDVLSDIDLGRMVELHTQNQALATLAMQHRKTSRYLLFDEQQELCGRQVAGNPAEVVRACRRPDALAFCGIHVISPRLLSLLLEDGAFSIINSYLRLAAQGEKILAFRADPYYWRDLGSPESIEQARHEMKQNVIAP